MHLDQFLGQWIDWLLEKFQQAILWFHDHNFHQDISQLKDLLDKGRDFAALWLHLISVGVAFTSDVLKPRARLFTKRLMYGGAGGSVASFFGIRYDIVPPEIGADFFVFCVSVAILSSVLLLLQHAKGEEGESNGALAALSPRIKLLQEKLGNIEGKIDDIQQDTQVIRENVEHLKTDLSKSFAEQVVALLDKREIAKAAEAGLERSTILELARPLRSGEAIDFNQAIVELRNAVAIALDVIARGERGTNQEAFVEDVLKRVAETSKKGDFDGGAKTVDEALAELDQAGRGAAPIPAEIAGNLAESGRRAGSASP